MSVSYDNASGSKEGADSSPLTWSHTIGSGSNRLLVVGVTNNSNTGTVSVTYDSASMTEWSHYHAVNSDSNPFLTFFYMKEANLPSSGAHDIVVTYGGGTSVVTAGAISFAGVDQTTPLQNKNEGTNGAGLSATITSSTDNMAVLFSGCGTFPGTLGGGGSPTERVRQEYDGSNYMNNIVGVTAAGAASVAITYTDVSDTYTWIGADVVSASVATTLDQEGFRFRNDDGDETSATWLASQDANVTAPLDTNTRIRFVLDGVGDPDATQFQLEAKLSTDSVWWKVA